jgi:hypothetical protein
MENDDKKSEAAQKMSGGGSYSSHGGGGSSDGSGAPAGAPKSSRTVTSEVHVLGCDRTYGEPDAYLGDEPLYISRYRVVVPPTDANAHDAEEHDGDSEDVHSDEEVVRRRPKASRVLCTYEEYPVVIYHCIETDIPTVGLQIWNACFLLADYLIHFSRDTSSLNDTCFLELGCGCGFVAVILSIFLSDNVSFVTDYLPIILDCAVKNLDANNHLRQNIRSGVPRCRLLDWSAEIEAEKERLDNYGWTDEDWQILGSREVVLLGADVIYGCELTVLFLTKAAEMLVRIATVDGQGSQKTDLKIPGRLLVTLEKRYNFEVDTQSVAAHGYNTFIRHINFSIERVQPIEREFTLILLDDEDTSGYYWIGRPVNVPFPQYCIDYHRNEFIEIWELELYKICTS